MKVAAALGCVALGGCHWLFQLNDLHAPPDGLTIDAREIDAYFGDAAPGCWSGAYTGDEDGDAVVDGCDNCPLMVNGNQADGDSDGVGDVCDSNPTMPLERIAYFHPLTKFNAIEWWIDGTNGNWMDNEYGVQQANRGESQQVVTYARLVDRQFDQPMAQLMVRGSTPDTDIGLSGTDRSSVALYLITGSDSSLGTPSGVRCGIDLPYTSETGAIAYVEKQNTSNSGRASTDEAAFPGLLRVDTLQPGKQPLDDVTPRCTLYVTSGVKIEPTFSAVMKADQLHIGMWTMNASATYVALFVTERRP